MKYLLILLLLVSSVSALTVPAPTTLVNDLANVIPADQESSLEQQLQAMKSSGAAEIAILTIPTLDGQDMNEFSIQTAEAWKLGTAEKDNGLLITVAVEDRAYRFEVGYGLEGDLNDARVGRIGRDILVPAFQSGNYGTGLTDAVTIIGGILNQDPATLQQVDTDPESYFYLLFFGTVIAGTIIGKVAQHQKTKGRKALVFGIGDVIVLALILWLASYFILYALFILLVTAIPGRGGMPLFLGGGRGGGGSIGGGGSFGGGGAGGKWRD